MNIKCPNWVRFIMHPIVYYRRLKTPPCTTCANFYRSLMEPKCKASKFCNHYNKLYCDTITYSWTGNVRGTRFCEYQKRIDD